MRGVQLVQATSRRGLAFVGLNRLSLERKAFVWDSICPVPTYSAILLPLSPTGKCLVESPCHRVWQNFRERLRHQGLPPSLLPTSPVLGNLVRMGDEYN